MASQRVVVLTADGRCVKVRLLLYSAFFRYFSPALFFIHGGLSSSGLVMTFLLTMSRSPLASLHAFVSVFFVLARLRRSQRSCTSSVRFSAC